MMPASTLDQIVSENQRANWYLSLENLDRARNNGMLMSIRMLRAA